MSFTRRAWMLAPAGLLPGLASAQPAPGAGTPYTLLIDEDMPEALHAQARAWVARSAQAVTAYFGRFPAPQAEITLAAGAGAGVRSGRTYDGPPPSIRVVVGHATTDAQFMDDWIMVHEMVHLAISQMPRRHNWFHEGAATYVEIIARARAGLTSQGYAWGGLMRNLHHGLPQAGDGGLDGTRRWGRTYWGGALFFLLCDLEIRAATADRLGLQDALAGLVRAGSHYGQRWPIAQTIAVADAAVGSPVMSRLYAQFKDDAVPVELAPLWQALGVSVPADSQGPVLLLDAAPRAATRRAIMAG
jgi:hypothetical protein